MIDAALLGIATGISVDQARHLIENDIPDDAPEHPFASLICELRETNRLLREVTAFTEIFKKGDLTQIIVLKLSPAWVKLDKYGRLFNRVFSPTNAVAVVLDVAGIGQINFTLAAGWNEIALPDGTGIALQSGTTQNLIYRCTNIPLGANVI